jgi:Domain of unknown function (DUF5642)
LTAMTRTSLASLAFAACALVVASCSSGPTPSVVQGDISRLLDVKSSFGPEFKVSTVTPAGIDPRLLAPQTLPQGVTFDPADCGKFASGLALPAGLKGNMSAVTAEGAGNRFIAIAVETSEELQIPDPGEDCSKVAFAGPGVRGLVEVTESPPIDGARTLGTHRFVQTAVNGKPASGELYNYVASFESFLVIVTANALVLPNAPVTQVDTQRARELLAAAVNDVRGS